MRTDPYRLRIALACILFLFSRPALSNAQNVLPEFSGVTDVDPTYVVVDILTSRGNTSDSTRVDCLYRLSNELLTFIKSGDHFAGHYELSLIVNDDHGYQMLAETIRDSVVVDSESATHTMDHSKAQLYTAYLPPGKFELDLKLLDIESSKQTDHNRSFVVPDYFKNPLSVSDIQFAGYVSMDPTGIGLNRHGLSVVPNLSRSYGEEQPDVYVYYEVYSTSGLDAQKPFTVTYRIKSPTGNLVLSETENLRREGEVGAYSRKFVTDGLAHGVYTVEVEVLDNALNKTAKMKGDFNVNWQYLLPLTTAKNYKDIVDQLVLIAKSDEVKDLKKLENVSGQEQQAALSAFWSRRDPTPGTDRNEFMITYYRRVDYANRHFTNGLGRGWRSDQGRIYILLGPPDEVERYTFESDSQPYQVWHYNQISRRVVFVDFDGYGRYQIYRVY